MVIFLVDIVFADCKHGWHHGPQKYRIKVEGAKTNTPPKTDTYKRLQIADTLRPWTFPCGVWAPLYTRSQGRFEAKSLFPIGWISEISPKAFTQGVKTESRKIILKSLYTISIFIQRGVQSTKLWDAWFCARGGQSRRWQLEQIIGAIEIFGHN